jgi:hypothetical protein
MIPASMSERIELSVRALAENTMSAESIGPRDYNDVLAAMLNEYCLGRSICTYCARAEVYLDVLQTDNKKAGWEMAIRLSYRCAKLMSTFVIEQYYIGNEKQHPGQYDYRASCPHYQSYEAAAKEKAEKAAKGE